MTTTTTRPRCARCGALPEALIHVGNHPTNCHPFTTGTGPAACPDWCTLTEQYHRDYGADHFGPTFEVFSDASVGTGQAEGGQIELSVWINGNSHENHISDPEQARRLARALLAAAEWLESQR